MTADENSNKSLVSVVIPCYNHGHYLGKAIDSVLAQQYAPIEVVVVDDGSTDNTAQVALNYGDRVRYVHKQNGGLSAARNTGIAHAKGEYIVFLDADDWLYPKAIETNLRYLQQNPKAAFVSGAFDRVNLDDNYWEEKVRTVEKDHYIEFLQGNYIGVPAAVMYRKEVLEEMNFDLSAPDSCGDYDLYLRIARNYPVLHHTEKIAAYNIHSYNMSSNSPMMLTSVLKVLERQKNNLRTAEEKAAYHFGFRVWKNYYCSELYYKLRSGRLNTNYKILYTLLRYKPKYFLKYWILSKYPALKSKNQKNKHSNIL